jgi:GMP synthase (glutamine-hydrolysing)
VKILFVTHAAFETPGYSRQIIRYDEKIYGFQCHLELTKELVKGMIENCPDDVRDGKYVNTREQLMAVNYGEINAKLHIVLDYIANSTS